MCEKYNKYEKHFIKHCLLVFPNKRCKGDTELRVLTDRIMGNLNMLQPLYSKEKAIIEPMIKNVNEAMYCILMELYKIEEGREK